MDPEPVEYSKKSLMTSDFLVYLKTFSTLLD